MIFPRLALCAAFAITALPARAETTSFEIMLFQDYAMYDEGCRGGRGDSDGTWKACGARQYVGFVLSQFGWCFGRDGQASYEMKWHRCASDSTPFTKPFFDQ